MTHEVPVTQARAQFAELINRVVYGGERVVVTRHGKPLIALVSADDLRRLQADEGVAAEPEQVISTVSRIGTGDHAIGERHRFGLTARHHDGTSPRHDAL